MSVDGTTTDIRTDIRPAGTVPAIPSPRTAEDPADHVSPVPAPEPALAPAHYPWPEPWGSSRGARPRSEYWDTTIARWCSSGPYPRPRPGS